MKIGLVDVDSHNFPNLCLMKLSEYHTREYHTRRGDRVEWWSPKGRYDLVYKSRVFTDTYSKDTIVVNNADQVIQGGTGYGPGGKDLPYEIEHIRPDYFLYPLRTRSNCWTPTCWPARTMRRCWNSLPPAGRWWTLPRDWTSG